MSSSDVTRGGDTLDDDFDIAPVIAPPDASDDDDDDAGSGGGFGQPAATSGQSAASVSPFDTDTSKQGEKGARLGAGGIVVGGRYTEKKERKGPSSGGKNPQKANSNPIPKKDRLKVSKSKKAAMYDQKQAELLQRSAYTHTHTHTHTHTRARAHRESAGLCAHGEARSHV